MTVTVEWLMGLLGTWLYMGQQTPFYGCYVYFAPKHSWFIVICTVITYVTIPCTSYTSMLFLVLNFFKIY
jgi:hypothetical protein